MKKKYSDWNIMTVNKSDLDPFNPVIEANHRYEYRLLPETVTKNYTPEPFASRGIVLTPIFFQASLTELDNYIIDLPEEIMLNLYDKCNPVQDKVMQLTLYQVDKDATKVSISMDNLKQKCSIHCVHSKDTVPYMMAPNVSAFLLEAIH